MCSWSLKMEPVTESDEMSAQMQQVTWLWKNFLRKLDDWEIRQKLRRLSKQGRRRAILLFLALVFIVYCLYPSSSSEDTSHHRSCLQERLRHYNLKAQDSAVGLDEWSVQFAGNGFMGVGVENDLRFRENGSRVLSLASGFHPLVRVSLPEASSLRSAEITDFEKGQWRRITCYDVSGECACIEEKVYAHATHKGLLMQELKIVNPTKNALEVDLSRPASSYWIPSPTTSDASSSSVSTREVASDVDSTVMAVICSSTPEQITVTQKREESLSYMCAAGVRSVPKGQDTTEAKAGASTDAVSAFQAARSVGAASLERKHEAAWNKLNSITFHLSPSKAPEVLNGVQINATRYMLMANVDALGMREGEEGSVKQSIDRALYQTDKCYGGHSALLYPSRLWQKWSSSADVVRIADLWLLTLEKKGCSALLHAGAQGVAKAFVMSLLAVSFDQAHLEVAIDPADLHRQMRTRGLTMSGPSHATVDINLHLDDENVPYMLVSSTGQVYACDAGCQDDPVTLGKKPVKMPVKLTKPLTSILYIATSRRHLLQLRSTIHVSEVAHAPAHELEVIALHEHGHRLGGLPTAFWVMLGVLLLAFHVFLVKLLWTEWRKGDTTPYNPYLRSRYSYVRSH